MLRWYIPCQ